MNLFSEQYRDLSRDILRIRNADLFMAAQLALFNADLTFGDFKLFGEIFHQCELAWPSTGGAVMATLNSSPCNPTRLSRLALGWITNSRTSASACQQTGLRAGTTAHPAYPCPDNSAYTG